VEHRLLAEHFLAVQVEVRGDGVEVLQVKGAVAADDLKADLAAGQARRQFGGDPQVGQHAAVEGDLDHDA